MSDSQARAATQETRDSIRSFVHRRFPMAVTAGVKDEESLLDSGVVDSLGILDIVAFLEESFAIQVGDEELSPENFDSIETLAGFVDAKRGGA